MTARDDTRSDAGFKERLDAVDPHAGLERIIVEFQLNHGGEHLSASRVCSDWAAGCLFLLIFYWMWVRNQVNRPSRCLNAVAKKSRLGWNDEQKDYPFECRV